jgi:hypothetical protein
LPQAKQPDTTLCHCLDCRIPQLMGSIEASGSIAAVNEFAGRLSGMTDREMLRYKAVLAATKCNSLQSSVALLDNLEHYMLAAKISSSEDAAISELNCIVGDNDVERLQQYMNLPAYGGICWSMTTPLLPTTGVWIAMIFSL